MKLPASIQAYFDADKAPGGGAPTDVFAPDAVVRDEGKTHSGRDAIGVWWRAAKAQYQHRSEPSGFREEGDRTVVRAKVTGQFPGSPAVLTFAFQLRDGQIAALEIGA